MRVAVVASAQIFGGFQNLPPPQSLDFSAFFGLSHLFPPRLSISVIFDTDLVTLHRVCYTGLTGGDFVQRLIFHVDVNSAFLSWEAARRVADGEPDLRLIPSAIGGDRDKRTGVILAKSIPAK